MDKLENEVKAIIEKYAFNKELVRNSNGAAKIISDLKINSARIVDIILDIEEKYDIMIEDNYLEKMITIEDVVQLIQMKIIK
jgi:acyl carrier protein